ncbi:tRNA 2-thiouridine synthesizing protein A [Sphingomonas vulcanisoli]|uniref:tRNA 2-thiouridine synthesizing protein A n=1 Tax=Sphingomonas vulcanisoli TaxID=1658060 RepID=A0ABX0TYM8_9SPHN|nr:sulfurtransferase TusA family protein [Sphingomonas vulcanisoli]NIJ08860.1 tRNA 2-thiouridine synthesizing protein A [Sphingomonas vulcanisoli]
MIEAPGETIVDARGMRCPWPVLRLARAMKGAEAVILLTDDPAAPAEIDALARSSDWDLIEISGGFSVRRSAA